uniref:Speedy/RINGO cell cycle regulator family member E4 n=1 Tax=Aotus nancymaae TaxID=37293 RepID=A0A2K5DFW4_AOTNA
MDRTGTRFCGREQSLGEIMTSHQPHPQVEYESPQPSTSGYSLPEMVDDEVPEPPVPWVDISPPRRSFGWKRTREWSDESEEEPEEEPEKSRSPEPEETWVVESLHGLKMKLKRRRVSAVLPEHHEAFNRLLVPGAISTHCNLCLPGTVLLAALLLPRKLCSTSHASICSLITEDPVVKRFLAWDKDLRVSDKYLLAMVIAYFSRAGLFSWQYRRIHFFLALYLANDMEEDNQAPKQDIFYFLYGKNRSQRPLFHKLRLQFVCSMRWRLRGRWEGIRWVGGWTRGGRSILGSPRLLKGHLFSQIQAYDPEHWVWARDRTLLS